MAVVDDEQVLEPVPESTAVASSRLQCYVSARQVHVHDSTDHRRDPKVQQIADVMFGVEVRDKRRVACARANANGVVVLKLSIALKKEIARDCRVPGRELRKRKIAD